MEITPSIVSSSSNLKEDTCLVLALEPSLIHKSDCCEVGSVKNENCVPSFLKVEGYEPTPFS